MRTLHRWLATVAVTGATALGFADTAAAHHSTAMFADKSITISGVVKEFQYTNPHSWLLVDVTKDDGSVETWGFEAEGPSTLMRAGISKTTLMPGTKVTVTARPMKDGRPAGSWSKIVLEDGKVLNPMPGQGK